MKQTHLSVSGSGLNAGLIISGGAESRVACVSLSRPLRRLCAGKNETLPPPYRPSCSDAASDFTPCQTPRRAALREQRQLLEPPSTGRAKQNVPHTDTCTQWHVHAHHTLPPLPLTQDVSGTAIKLRADSVTHQQRKGHRDNLHPLKCFTQISPFATSKIN